MFPILKLLLFSILFGSLSAACNYTCPCPDLLDHAAGNPTTRVYEKGVGCTQSLKCTSTNVIIFFLKEYSTIPDIGDNGSAALFNSSIPQSELPVITVDYFSDYGMVCEDGRWFATKFPMGVNYGFGPFAPEVTNGKGYRGAINYLTSNPNVITYEEGPGCSQSFTCTELNHFAYFLKDSSTVPGIQDEWSAWLSNGTQTDFSLPTTTKEFVSSFGLVCENSTWFATKFPFGIFSLGSLRLSSDETNGKGYRAKIRSLGC